MIERQDRLGAGSLALQIFDDALIEALGKLDLGEEAGHLAVRCLAFRDKFLGGFDERDELLHGEALLAQRD